MTSASIQVEDETTPSPTLMFLVRGTPRPQGSMRAIPANGRVFMKHSNTLVEWRNIVVDRAIAAMNKAADDHGWPATTALPVGLDCTFIYPRPKSHSLKRRREDGGVKANGADLDKLIRAIGDALTAAGVIQDDKQITDIAARKRYTDAEGIEMDTPGAVIRVTIDTYLPGQDPDDEGDDG